MDIKDKMDTKIATVEQAIEIVTERLNQIGPVMDDYDGGQVKAYKTILKDLKVMGGIITAIYKGKMEDNDELWAKLDDGAKYNMPDNYGVDQGGSYEK